MASAASALPRRTREINYKFIPLPRDFDENLDRLTYTRLEMVILRYVLRETIGKAVAPGSITPEYTKPVTLAALGKLGSKKGDKAKDSSESARTVVDHLVKYGMLSYIGAAQSAKLGLKTGASRSRCYKVNWQQFPTLKVPPAGPFAGTWSGKPEDSGDDEELPGPGEDEELPVAAEKVVSIGRRQVQPGKRSRWKFPDPQPAPSVDVEVEPGSPIEADVARKEDGGIVVTIQAIQQDTKPQTTVNSGLAKGKPPQAPGEAGPRNQPPTPDHRRAKLAELFEVFRGLGRKVNDSTDFEQSWLRWKAIPVGEYDRIIAFCRHEFAETPPKFIPLPQNVLRDRGWERRAHVPANKSPKPIFNERDQTIIAALKEENRRRREKGDPWEGK